MSSLLTGLSICHLQLEVCAEGLVHFIMWCMPQLSHRVTSNPLASDSWITHSNQTVPSWKRQITPSHSCCASHYPWQPNFPTPKITSHSWIQSKMLLQISRKAQGMYNNKFCYMYQIIIIMYNNKFCYMYQILFINTQIFANLQNLF